MISKIVLFILFCILLFSCDSEKVRVNPEVQKAIEYISQTDMLSKAKSLNDFLNELNNEKQLDRLAINLSSNEVFAICSEKILDAYWDPHILSLVKYDAEKWSNNEIEHIEQWIKKCYSNKVYGYDLRYMPAYIYIYIKPNIYLAFMSDKTPEKYREGLEQKAVNRFDARGDYFTKLSKDIFVGTERR